MPRWMILAGSVVLIIATISAIGPIRAQSLETTLTQAIVGTSQAVGVATAQIGPMTPAPPIGIVPPVTPIYPGEGRQVLRLTPRDSGGIFSVPVGTLIEVYVPRFPRTSLDYDPSILQEIFARPVPLPYDGGLPNANATPMTTEGTPVPNSAGPQLAPIAIPWRLLAIAPGTTPLVLRSLPCPPGQLCPMIAVIDFHVTIIVEGFVYPYPTPMPPLPPVPPYSYSNPDVYIGTAYLDQTVIVQPGQVIAVELPFLAPGELITLNYDSNVLSPLPGQDFQHPQPGGWLFRMNAPGKTLFTVQTTRCMDGSNECTPSFLFRVTITSDVGGQ